MGESFDLRKHRLLLTLSLYLVFCLFLYVYIFDIVVILTLVFATWLTYDYIQNYTKQQVDPSGKYVFITGCDSGFGLESAKAIRDLGFDVIAGCYDDNSAGARELKGRPWVQKVEVISLDVTSENSVAACAKEIKDICRDNGLWAVINNSGINSMGPTELVPLDVFHRTAEVNLFGAVRVTKAVLPLIRQAEGRVINVTSERGFNPWGNNSSYCISKFGLEAFSACLRTEMQRFKVKVITVAPGNFAGATSIVSSRANEVLKESLVKGRSSLSLSDQESAYPREEIDKILEGLELNMPKSNSSAQPVVEAYVDAVSNTTPKNCYMVKSKMLDNYIVAARLRPFIPERLMFFMDKVIMTILY